MAVKNRKHFRNVLGVILLMLVVSSSVLLAMLLILSPTLRANGPGVSP